MLLILLYACMLETTVIIARQNMHSLQGDSSLIRKRYLKHGTRYRNNLLLKRIQHAKQRNATCMDGSDAHYYLGQQSSSTNWIIHLQSGGSCITESECRVRANGPLGSSIPLDSKITGDWMLSDDSNINPVFYDWNKVLIPYCSGDVFIGRQLRDKHPYRLPMVGHYILVAVIEDLIQKYKLRNEDVNILFGGTSAGGVGVLANIDYIQRITYPAKVKGYVDSGWFTLYPSFGEKQRFGSAKHELPTFFHILTTLFNIHWDGFVDESCRQKMPKKPAACLYGELAITYIETPIYVLSMLWDTYQMNQMNSPIMPSFHAPPASQDEINYFSEFGNNTKRTLSRVLSNHENGVFAASCYSHTFFASCVGGTICDYPIEHEYRIQGQTAYDGLSEWYTSSGRKGSYIDNIMLDPACNPSCCSTNCYKCRKGIDNEESFEDNEIQYGNLIDYKPHKHNQYFVYYSSSSAGFNNNMFYICLCVISLYRL